MVLAAAGIGVFATRCSTGQPQFAPLKTARVDTTVTADLKDYARDQQDTYFTYPEWYIVWSYQEKSDYQQLHLPSGFPYFKAISQYWQAYCCATSIVAGRYPFAAGDHLMLMVIGSSFTAEYALKAAYERTVGRLSEWISGEQPAQEDIYAARVAKEYADFVHVRPFYEFSFAKSFQKLWSENDLWGPHLFRKWERRFFLSFDYGIESIYCGIITAGTHAVYGVESADTYARITGTTPQTFQDNPHMRRVKDIGQSEQIVIIPRYQEFTDTAQRLAKSGVRFLDIAGNGEVLLTLLLQPGAGFTMPESQQLFSSEIPIQAGVHRVGVRCAVRDLHTVLNSIDGTSVKLEHIYDY